MLNYLQVYLFIRLLVKPYNKWDAFKSGVIDDKGNVIVKDKDRSDEQKRAFTLFDRLVLGIKKRLAATKSGITLMSSFAAALYLIEEHSMFSDELNESRLEVDVEDLVEYVEEELATVSAGLAIDGTWVPKRKKRKGKSDVKPVTRGIWAVNPDQ